MVGKVASFLKNCQKNIFGCGIVFLKPRLLHIAEEFAQEIHNENKDKNLPRINWGLWSTVGQIPKFVYTNLSLHYPDYKNMKIKFIFEESGNSKDFQKRLQEIERCVLQGIEDYLKKFKSLSDHPFWYPFSRY